ncbi:transcription initiation factor IID, 31kD subunit-domain-containing protein [Chytriomyces sp. MP71]|nr:transcription initiation factor IID, 31kD subunit-domain-containing protein [Chytriomyces sp. MP71]
MPTPAEHQEPLELPRNGRLVSLMMQAMDVRDYSPAVLPQLLEFMNRYVLDVVGDAQLFADHASRTEIELDDVRLAVEAKMSHSFTAVPSKEVMTQIAEVKNIAPLPIVGEKLGLRLPPERNALTGVNFQILPRKPNLNFEERAASKVTAPAALQQQQQQQQEQQQQFMQQQAFQMPFGMGGAPTPQPFMFGGMGAFNPAMNMNMGMNMGIGMGMPMAMPGSQPGEFMGMMQMQGQSGQMGTMMQMPGQPVQQAMNFYGVPQSGNNMEEDYDDE